MAAPTYSILIPYQPDGGVRDVIAQWTVARWKAICPEAEIVTAGDGGGEQRNRSRMRNACARQATTNTLVFVDSDCLFFSAHEMRALLDLLTVPGAGMAQYHAVSRLTMDQSTQVMRQRPGATLIMPDGCGFTHTIVGGIFAITRGNFEKAGGFDERFVGWGGEDPAFQRAVRTLCGPILRVPYLLYHLWHTQGPEYDQESPVYKNTLAHFARYEEADGNADAMRALIGDGYAVPEQPHLIGYQEHYPPKMLAGAEQSMRALMCHLRARGYRITVVTRPGYPGTEYDGIPVIASPDWEKTTASLLPAQALISGHNGNIQVAKIGAKLGIQTHCLIHNDSDATGFKLLKTLGAHVVANTQWVAEAVQVQDVLHPIVRPDWYTVEPTGDGITLINLGENKGGVLFWELAKRLPKHHFIGVKGAYEDQVIPKRIPKNVTLIDTTADMPHVYKMTRVLLMPSRYESYGRTAIEAAASGIPTIAHPTPGLREALGAAGIYANRDNPDDWVTAIRALTSDPVAYSRRSRQVQKRFAASQVTSAGEIDRLIARIEHP
jgi:hypothetical protein